MVVPISHLRVAYQSNRRAVPDPLTRLEDVELFHQFRFVGCSHVVMQLWPLRQSGSLDDLCPKLVLGEQFYTDVHLIRQICFVLSGTRG